MVQRSTQFEQGGALAAGKFEGGGDVGGAGGGVCVGCGRSRQFGVVEAHPGIAGQLQCGVQAVALFAQYILLLGEVEQKVIGCF